jgi:hypothetical protein
MNFRLGFCLLGLLPAVSNAAVLTVTTPADSGAGSLRNQVAASTSGDTIQFAVTGPIHLLSAINIPHSLAVQGPGPAALIIDAGHHDRAFVTAGTVIFSGMTIRNGLSHGINGPDGGPGGNGLDGTDAQGGAILDTNSSSDFLYLTNCWLDSNMAVGGNGGNGGTNAPNVPTTGNGGNGGSAFGGAVEVYGFFTNINCTFSDNRAIGGQGGNGGENLYHAGVAGGTAGNGGEADGGATLTDGHIGFVNCTFSGNSAAGGPGGQGGGNGPDVAPGMGGNGGSGASGNAGAIYFYTGEYYCCTIVSNSAFAGAGGLGGSGAPPGANGAPGYGNGGGTYSPYPGPCVCDIGNTILADNYADTSGSNYVSHFSDDGYNFIGSDDYPLCSWSESVLVGTIALPIHSLLGPLMQNGGGLPTHATTLTSPVTDQGLNFGLLFGETTDERGAPRPYVWSIPEPPGGDGSDIGAFELGSADLAAAISGNGVVLSWPAWYGDFTLQSATSLKGANIWSDVPDTPVQVGNQVVVTNRTTNSLTFYRLVIH